MRLIHAGMRISPLIITLAGLLFIAEDEQIVAATQAQNERNIMITIDKGLLQKAAKENAYIGVVVVTSIKIIYPGTRGERVLIKIKVKNKIHGPDNEPAGISYYTNKGQALLQEGKKYLVVLRDVIHVRPNMGMEAYQGLSCDDCKEIIDACKQIILNNKI